MKILMLNYEYPPVGGGGAEVSKELSESLVNRGHHVDVVTMACGELRGNERRGGVNIHRTCSLRKSNEISHLHEHLMYILSSILFVLIYKNENYDIIHSHFIVPTGIAAYVLSYLLDVPYVITSHGSDVLGYNNRFKRIYPVIKPIWKKIGENAETIVTPSKFLERNVRRISDSIDTKVIYNGVKPDKFSHKKGKNYILTCSRLHEDKGIQDLIEAVSEARLGDWEIRIMGDGPYREKLEELVVRRGLEDKIQFLGWLDNSTDRYVKHFEECSIFVSPSYKESFNMTLLHAKSSRCAVIASNIETHKELYPESYFFETHNISQLRNEIVKVMEKTNESDISESKELKNFYWSKITKEYQDMYEELT